MNMNDSFFDNIEIVNQNTLTYNKPQTICKSLERTFATCTNQPKKSFTSHNQFQEDSTIQRNHSYKLDYYLKQKTQQQNTTAQSKSYRSIKPQDTSIAQIIPQKSYLKQQMRLKINLENDAYQSNLRQKTQSSHNTTNPYQMSLATLMKQQMQKQQQSIANICKTMNDDSKLRVSSTYRQSIIPQNQKIAQRQDSLNIRKSNSVYMQEFRKVFSKNKYSIHNNN